MFNVDYAVQKVHVLLENGIMKKRNANFLPVKISAQSTLRSSKSPNRNFPQHSVLDAVCRCLTAAGVTNYSERDVAEVALLLVDGLTREILSGDKLMFAMDCAIKNMQKHGLTSEAHESILKLLALGSEKNRRSNPISGMF